MYLRTGDIIKHKSFMDVAFQVTGAFYGTHDMVVYGRWLNQGFTEMYVIEKREHWFRITEDQMANWVVKSNSLRASKWTEIKGAA